MKNNIPKRIALKTLLKHKCYALKYYAELQRIIELHQFTIIPYKKHANTEEVSELIKRLRIENEIEQNDSFLYINQNLKLVFINRDVPEEERCALLRHELGHICDPDFLNPDMQNSKIKKEEFANAFSCYAKNPGICFRFIVFLMKKWKLFVALMALIVCILGWLFVINPRINPKTIPAAGEGANHAASDRVYYVTIAGEKFHQKHCIIIKYKNNLTEIALNEALTDGYKPCMICNPTNEYID